MLEWAVQHMDSCPALHYRYPDINWAIPSSSYLIFFGPVSSNRIAVALAIGSVAAGAALATFATVPRKSAEGHIGIAIWIRTSWGIIFLRMHRLALFCTTLWMNITFLERRIIPTWASRLLPGYRRTALRTSAMEWYSSREGRLPKAIFREPSRRTINLGNCTGQTEDKEKTNVILQFTHKPELQN